MTASPGIPRARIMPSGHTRDGVTTPPPHPLRRGAAVDDALSAQVTRYARCAESGLDPDQWFPVSVDPARARQEAAAANRGVKLALPIKRIRRATLPQAGIVSYLR